MSQLLKLLFLDIIWDIVYFPIWWYSQGLLQTIKWAVLKIVNLERTLSIGVWIVNLFRPMYGQRDLAGKLISFLMRIVQIVFRGMILVFGSLCFLLLAFAWLIAPLIIISQLIKF